MVTAAVVRRGETFLVTRRQRGVHLEGYWEFPGGKQDAGESLEDCLRREIREELDVDVTIGRRLLSCAHEYPSRVIELHFFEAELQGEPTAVMGQEMRWVSRGDLKSLQFPPADDELIALLSAS